MVDGIFSKKIQYALDLAEKFETAKGHTINNIANLLLIKNGQDFLFIKHFSWKGFVESVKNVLSIVFLGKYIFLENRNSVFEIAKTAQAELLKHQSVVPAEKLAVISKKIKTLGKYISKFNQRSNCVIAAKTFINFAVKKNIENRSAREEKLHQLYDGNSINNSLEGGCQQVIRYLNNPDSGVDMPGLKRIAQNRKIMSDIYNSRSLFAPCALSKRVQALADPDSDEVVQLEDGATFCIPSGCKGHYVTYEVKRTNNNYFFIIHNRGFGSNDPELHGSLGVQRNGLCYSKGSVVIQVTKDHLTPKFFADLLLAKNFPTMNFAYGCIKKHLLKAAYNGLKGSIVKSQEELLAEQLEQELSKCKHHPKEPDIQTCLERIYDVLIEKNILQSKQTYGTCTESNKTAAEAFMCDKKTRRQLRLDTIRHQVAHISLSCFLQKNIKKELLELGGRRMTDLQQKIA